MTRPFYQNIHFAFWGTALSVIIRQAPRDCAFGIMATMPRLGSLPFVQAGAGVLTEPSDAVLAATSPLQNDGRCLPDGCLVAAS